MRIGLAKAAVAAYRYYQISRMVVVSGRAGRLQNMSTQRHNPTAPAERIYTQGEGSLFYKLTNTEFCDRVKASNKNSIYTATILKNSIYCYC
uniref:Uncharacterized protein n=1 Tax=Oryza barthii TaxID=65489 RepID=A0A0D3GXI9_9ORYZ